MLYIMSIREFKRYKRDAEYSSRLSNVVKLSVLDDKNARENVDWFVSEIARVELQIEKLSKSDDVRDVVSLHKYVDLHLPKLKKAMNAKFSKDEIMQAEAKFKKNYRVIDGFYQKVR